MEIFSLAPFEVHSASIDAPADSLDEQNVENRSRHFISSSVWATTDQAEVEICGKGV